MTEPIEPKDQLQDHSSKAIIASGSVVPVRYDQDNMPGMYQSPPEGKPVLTLLMRFKWTILAGFAAVSVPVLAVIWTFVIPQYCAHAEVRVRPIIPRLVYKMENNGLIPLYRSYLNTQASVARGPTVLQRVLDRPAVQRTSWYKNSPRLLGTSSLPPLERLKEDLKVRPRGGTEIIDLTMVCPDPKDASIILNAVLDEYKRFIAEKNSQTDDLLYKTLVDEFNSLRVQIESRESIADQLRKELGTGIPEELISRRRVRLDDLEAQLASLKRRISVAQWQQEQLDKLETQAAQAVDSDDQSNIRSKYAQDGEWRRLWINSKTAKHRVQVEQQSLGQAHPTMLELNKQVELAGQLLAAREAQLDTHWLTHPGQSLAEVTMGFGTAMNRPELERYIKLLKHQEQYLVKDVDAEREKFNSSFDSAQMLSKENDIIRYKRERYSDVRIRLDQKELERNVPGSIELQSRAFVPSKAYRDRRVLFSVLALGCGLFAGLALSYLRASNSQIIHEASDLQHVVRAPFLGQLPLVRSSEGSPLDSPALSECIRMVRTGLLQRLAGRGGAVLITSAIPGEGKTTMAVMLAKSLAQCGKKVLLVDADFRNPMLSAHLSQRFGISTTEVGLISSLTSEGTIDDTVIATDTPGLSILPVGKVDTDMDFELLANGVFSAWLDRHRKNYDIVLFDSPPVLPVADARILSHNTDGTIMVVREKLCKRSQVLEALEYLGAAGGRLLGTVYIGSNRGGGRYGYQYYYGYPYYGTNQAGQAEANSLASINS